MATAAQLRAFGRPDLAKKTEAKEKVAATVSKNVARMGGGEAAGNPNMRKTIATTTTASNSPIGRIVPSGGSGGSGGIRAITPPTVPELGTVGGQPRVVPEGFIPRMPLPPRNADGTERDFSKPNASAALDFNKQNPRDDPKPNPNGRVYPGGSKNFNEATGKYRNHGTGPNPNPNARRHASPNARFNRGASSPAVKAWAEGLQAAALAARTKYETDNPKPASSTIVGSHGKRRTGA